jgi:Putative metallopeptidase
MKWLLPAMAVALTAVAFALSQAAIAQAPSIPANPQIDVAYVPPTDANLVPIYDRLRDRKVLETLQQFLAPLKLERRLLVKFDQCGATSLRYKPGAAVTVCYEYIGQIERLAPRTTVALVQGGVTPESALVGPVVQQVLHELAIALFDQLDVPVWGRLDDAADRVSAFIMLQFGSGVAWNTIVGTTWFLAGNATLPPDFADVRGAIAQRYYTTLCIAYGGEKRGQFGTKALPGFSEFVKTTAAGSLPASRAANCADEYDLIRQAFDDTIMPRLDPELLKQVQGVNWVSISGAK